MKNTILSQAWNGELITIHPTTFILPVATLMLKKEVKQVSVLRNDLNSKK